MLKKNCQTRGLSMQLYLVRLPDGTPVKARPSSEIRELRTEVHKIGLNINKIARNINAIQYSANLAKRVSILEIKIYVIYQTVTVIDK